MIYTFESKQIVHTDIDTLWEFMSSPKNLAVLTPSYMGFRILSDSAITGTMYPGQIIQYHVSPILGIKLHWVTEITHVRNYGHFIDEQRIGPYAFWHHQHFFQIVPEGVEMRDVVHYKPPFGFLGRIANALFIKKQLQGIFNYRQQKIMELFPKIN